MNFWKKMNDFFVEEKKKIKITRKISKPFEKPKTILNKQPLAPSQRNAQAAMIVSLIVVIGFHYFLGDLFIDLFRIFGIGKAVYYGMLVFIFFSGTGLGVMMLNASEAFRKAADK